MVVYGAVASTLALATLVPAGAIAPSHGQFPLVISMPHAPEHVDKAHSVGEQAIVHEADEAADPHMSAHDTVEAPSDLAACDVRCKTINLFCYTIGAALFYVLAIIAIAYPAHLVRNGREPFSTKQEWGFLAAHCILLGIGPLYLYVEATQFGPVSMQLPLYMSGVMMWNIPLMYALGMETFNKTQRTATIMVFWAAVTILDVGPQVPDTVTSLPEFTSSCVAWLVALGVLWVVSSVIMAIDFFKPDAIKNQNVLMLNYAIVQGIGTGGNASASKFAMAGKALGNYEIAAIGGALVVALGGTDSVGAICAAKKLNPAVFAPIATLIVIGMNLATDFLVWGAFSMVEQWTAFVAANASIVCGVYVLSNVDLFEKASTAMPALGGYALFANYQRKSIMASADLSDDAVLSLFKQIDVSGDGLISEGELRAALSDKIVVDPDEFEAIITEFCPKEGSSQKALTPEAFKKVMMNFKIRAMAPLAAAATGPMLEEDGSAESAADKNDQKDGGCSVA